MVTNFVRGQKAKLSESISLLFAEVKITVSLGEKLQVDVFCFGLDSQNKLVSKEYLIFHNQQKSPCGGIAVISQTPESKTFLVTFQQLPNTIHKLVFATAINDPGLMSQIDRGYLQIFTDQKESFLFSFCGTEFDKEKTIILGEIYWRECWRFGAVGQGFKEGVEVLLKNLGADLALLNTIKLDGNKVKQSLAATYNDLTDVNSINALVEKLCSLGQFFFESKQYDTALDFYQEAIKTDNTYLIAYHGLGQIYLTLDRTEEAIKTFKTVLDISPNYEDIYFLLASAYKKQDYVEEAIMTYKQVIKISPRNFLAYTLLGSAYRSLGYFLEAVEIYRHLIYLQPNEPTYYRFLGDVYGEMGQWDNAIDSYKKAIQRNPKDNAALYEMGVAYGIINSCGEEINAYKQVLENTNHSNDFYKRVAYYRLGLCYVKQGNNSLALEQYNTLKDLDKTLADSLFNFISS